MKIKIRKTTLLLLTALTLTGCDEEKLSDRSVIDDGKQQIETTQLDNWILDNITKPYGIEVIYRWEKNTGSTGTFIYPPKLENVRAILEAVRELGLETYRLKEVGGADFLLGRLPIKLYLYGGGNPDENGVERLNNPQLTAAEMCLYNVNDFNPGDADKMFVLMRSVHHQLAKRLMQLIAYDRDKFFTISGHRYTGSTELIAAQLGYASTGKRSSDWMLMPISEDSIQCSRSFRLKTTLLKSSAPRSPVRLKRCMTLPLRQRRLIRMSTRK